MVIKDPEARRRYHREWYAKRRADWFKGKVCAKCGSIDELELDHIDRAQKVSHKIWSWSLARREAELAKCQPLCRNCHYKKSDEDRERGGPVIHGKNRTYVILGCRCDTCRAAHAAMARKYRSKGV